MEKTYDINIESTILSSIIYSPILLQKYINKINQDIFFLPLHKKIIMIFLELFHNNKIIDETIILNKLGKEFENDLLYIISKKPIINIDDYLEILNDLYLKREMRSLALEITNSLNSPTSGLELQSKVNIKTEQLLQNNQIKIFEINNIEDIEDKEIEFICKSWLPIPKKTVSLISAPGGTGKSWLILQLAIKTIQEDNLEKVFLWLSEDPKEISKNRFNKIFTEILNIQDDSIKLKIDISDSSTIQFLYENQRKIEISPLFIQFKTIMQNYDLIILDPLIAFYGADENNNSQARKFMQLFTHWANKENKTIIFIHHSTKNKTQSRGASAFVDAVRTVYELDTIKDANNKEIESNKRIIKLTKDNYGIKNILKTNQIKRVLFPFKNKNELNMNINTIETFDIIHSDF